MEKNLSPIAKELFGKIRTQFPKIQLGDADSQVTDRPEDARFFEFDFVKRGLNLGTISVDISEDDGLVVIYSNDIAEEEPDGVKREWFNFLRELREFAKQNMMKFSIRDTAKSNLDKRDYQQLAKKNGEDTMPTSMNESKFYGTNKTSFQDLGEARLIIKHTQPVNTDIAAGRTMHIESIYVENAAGERFKYPYKHLSGARALAEHLKHGGNPYDTIGKHITSLSEELAGLRKFKGYVSRQEQLSEAMGNVTIRVLERIQEIKKHVEHLQRPAYYETFAESYEAAEEQMLPEELVNDLIDRLTIRTFNEELKAVFPYIAKFVNESELPILEVDASDILGEEEVADDELTEEPRELEEFHSFESFLNSIVAEESDLFNMDDESQSAALQKLNQLMAQEFPGGADGTNAIQSLKGIIDDSELNQALKVVAKLDPEGDMRDIIKQYLEKKDEENGTDIASKVNFSAQAPAAAPVAPVAPTPPTAPTPPAPVAEAKTGIAAAIAKAKKAGATAETVVNFGFGEMSLGEAIGRAGLNVEEFFESSGKQNEVVEFVKSMYDETTGNFPKGETGVLLAVEKQFGEDAAQLAHQVISELSHVYESQRLRQLAGLV
jgi:arsenate reductase-like glutaredoxin family protein